MLSRDLVHMCDHQLPTREEKREKVKKGKKNNNKMLFLKKEKHTKQTNKQRPCFFHFLHPWFPHSKLPKTITQKIKKNSNLLKTDSFSLL